MTYLKATVEGSEDLFEGRNAEGDGAYAPLDMKRNHADRLVFAKQS